MMCTSMDKKFEVVNVYCQANNDLANTAPKKKTEHLFASVTDGIPCSKQLAAVGKKIKEKK
jgi:hypothetical protein